MARKQKSFFMEEEMDAASLRNRKNGLLIKREQSEMFKIFCLDPVKATTSVGGLEDTEIPFGQYYAGNMIMQIGEEDTDAVVINDIDLRMPFLRQSAFQNLVEIGIIKLAKSA